MLEIYQNYKRKFCDPGIFGEMETDTVSLYLALADKK